MSQMSFSDFEYPGKPKRTRRERFLAEMDQVVPYTWLRQVLERLPQAESIVSDPPSTHSKRPIETRC